MMEHISFEMNDKPCMVSINLDSYPLGYGMKGIEITWKDKIITFTTEEIFSMLEKLKE